jgi:hypothetical protein
MSSLSEFINAMTCDRKIDAIKAFRNLTGQGLKESKDAVEALLNLRPAIIAATAEREAWQRGYDCGKVDGQHEAMDSGVYEVWTCQDDGFGWNHNYVCQDKASAIKHAEGYGDNYDVIVTKRVAYSKRVRQLVMV